MNIQMPNYFTGFRGSSNSAVLQAQKAQEAASQKLEDVRNNTSSNIYQQQSDIIREERNLHDIDIELANEEKKVKKKEAKEKLEDEMKHLTTMYDADTAKEMLSSNIMMKSALQADPDNTDTDSASILEADSDLNMKDQADILDETVSSNVAPVDKIIISDDTIMQQRKMVADLYQSSKVLP